VTSCCTFFLAFFWFGYRPVSVLLFLLTLELVLTFFDILFDAFFWFGVLFLLRLELMLTVLNVFCSCVI
jgi:hypothetical protein